MWKTWTTMRNIASHIADLWLSCDRKSGALCDDAMEVNGFRVRRCRGSSQSGSARAGDLVTSNWCQTLTADVRRCEKTRTRTVRSKLHHLQETIQRHWNWNANAWSSQSMKTLHVLCTILPSMWGRGSCFFFVFSCAIEQSYNYYPRSCCFSLRLSDPDDALRRLSEHHELPEKTFMTFLNDVVAASLSQPQP